LDLLVLFLALLLAICLSILTQGSFIIVFVSWELTSAIAALFVDLVHLFRLYIPDLLLPPRWHLSCRLMRLLVSYWLCPHTIQHLHLPLPLQQHLLLEVCNARLFLPPQLRLALRSIGCITYYSSLLSIVLLSSIVLPIFIDVGLRIPSSLLSFDICTDEFLNGVLCLIGLG